MDKGWWVGNQWMTLTGTSTPLCHSSCIRQLTRKNRTLLVVGDSTMRFMYAAILSALNVKHQYPNHRLPSADECSFERVGWPTSGKCALRWRGPCRDDKHGCTYAHMWHKTRLVFTWWRNRLPLTLPVNRNVDLLLVSTGIWEAMGIKNTTVYRETVRNNIRAIIDAVRPHRSILFSNGVCLGFQKVFFKSFSHWPTPGMEERIIQGNTEIETIAKKENLIFFDRTWSMITGNDTNSPCIFHHPYGKASELHASFALSQL